MGDGDDDAAARSDFLHIGKHFVAHRGFGRDGDHRQVFIDQGDRAVLHLARRIAFGMDIGNFLQLERPFQSDRIVQMAPEIKEVGLAEKLLGGLFDAGRLVQRFADGQRQMRQPFQKRPDKIRSQRPSALADVERQKKERRQLAR